MLYVLLLVVKIAVCLLLGIIVCIVLSKEFPSFRRYRLIQKLPGPKGVLLFGNAPELKNVPCEDLLLWITRRMKDYDRMMRLWLTVVSNVYIKDPNDIQVLFNSIQHINKGHEYFMLKPWLEEGLLTSSGDKWHSRRKLLTPAFHFKILEENMSLFNRNAKILCRKLENTKGREVVLEPYTRLCMLDIIIGTAMGINLNLQLEGGLEYVSHLKKLSELFTERMMRPHLFIDWIFNLSKTGRQFRKAISYLHDYSYKVIKEKKQSFQNSTDVNIESKRKTYRAFLHKLLEFEAKNPGSLSDKDIREEVDTFMFAGHDTTASAILFIFFNISIYPDIQDKIYAELTEIFNNSDRDTTANDLNKMVYLEKVIKESLRLYPSVPVITRLLDKDLVLNDGAILPSRTNVIALIYLVHRNAKYWDNPEKFDPERFSPEQVQGRHPYAYIPFSAGPRNCIGQKYAMMKLKTVASTVLRKLKIHPVSRVEDFKLMVLIGLRTDNPIKCRFTIR